MVVINAYILYTKSLQLGSNLSLDLVYVSSRGKYNMIRINNIEVEYLLVQLPGMSNEDFNEFIRDSIKNVNNISIEYTHMKDSCCYSFNHLFRYARIKSTSVYDLRRSYESLTKNCIKYYNSLDKSTLRGFDKMLYKNMESPFRYTQNVLNVNNIPYYMATRYDIPCVGGKRIDLKYTNEISLEDTINMDFFESVRSTSFNHIKKTFIEVVNESDMDSINRILDSVKVMSYDIETYIDSRSDHPHPTDSNEPIIAIGFSVFNINNPKPINRYCVTSKRFINNSNDGCIYITPEESYMKSIMDASNGDCIEYSKRLEPYLLKTFIRYINRIHPYMITGFNNWTFDDVCIHNRLVKYNLEKSLIDATNYYLEDRYRGSYRELNIKMDGTKIKDVKYYTWIKSFTTFHDCMIAAKKEDPKRFSERSRGNLDTMLEVYSIKNPYEDSNKTSLSTLSKTGLDIWLMMTYWKSNEHIYEIAKYCCQDAWITGTFAITRNMFGDLIEMSDITHTSLQDSLFKAVGIRVCNTISYYAYHEGFALFDTPHQESRSNQLTSPLGGKYFDRRTLIGGAVKNKRNGREFFIQAVDYSSMYPSQKEGSNVDTSSRVFKDLITNPDEYGMKIVNKYFLEDMYCGRWFYELVSVNDPLTKYSVEQNFGEFKLDHKYIHYLLDQYRLHPTDKYIYKRLVSSLYPLDPNEIIMNPDYKLPLTVLVDMYFVQSPKDTNEGPHKGLPLKHYSLKEHMLSDFRYKRSLVKKRMSETKNITEKIQLSAKEKAIKVVMNSEYGQTGSDVFGHFDSDIGAAVTFASRHCILECTSCLESRHFYVDDSYLTNPHLKKLIDLGIATLDKNHVYMPSYESSKEGSQRSSEEWDYIREHCYDSNLEFVNEISIDNHDKYNYSRLDYILPPRRLTSCKLYESLLHSVNSSVNDSVNDGVKVVVNRITLPPSQLVYQDTDSNYYTNETIVNRYEDINPESIESIMNDLYEHNLLLSDLIPSIINRRPIGVGFEGAFVVARYLNKKKKYYGKKWLPGSMKTHIEMIRDPSKYLLNEYESNHIIKRLDNNTVMIEYDYKHLPDDYEEYLNTRLTNGHYNTYNNLVPYKDGSYINPELYKRDHLNDQLDFVMNNGLKCTGVDLARRDQFKFINFNNILVFKYDLRYTHVSMEYNVKNFIKNHYKFPIKNVIDQLLMNFKNSVTSILDDELIEDSNWYPLEYFTRQKMLKKNCNTEMEYIVKKIDRYLDTNTSMSSVYKTYMNQLMDLKRVCDYGQRLSYLCVDPFNDNGLVVEDEDNRSMGYLIDHLRILFNGNDTNIFKVLDYHYYFSQLAVVLSNFVVIEQEPSIIDFLDGTYEEQHPELNKNEIKEIMDKTIKKVKETLANEYVNKYFPKRVLKKIVNRLIDVDIHRLLTLEEIVMRDHNINVNKTLHIDCNEETYKRWLDNDPNSMHSILYKCEQSTRRWIQREPYNSNLNELNDLYHSLLIKVDRSNKLQIGYKYLTLYYNVLGKDNDVRYNINIKLSKRPINRPKQGSILLYNDRVRVSNINSEEDVKEFITLHIQGPYKVLDKAISVYSMDDVMLSKDLMSMFKDV